MNLLIYIPIWFYSNLTSLGNVLSNIFTFTFQSGSILMILNCSVLYLSRNIYIPIWFYSNVKEMEERGAKLKFTFQSGSILINIENKRDGKVSNLHSNLVLF